ncbi:hypothetical protein TEA_024149 [Camellia sinensis var. sinensis]|uniref:Uncharacterized protein n=1 Tax=Camellia sinensis var. sinensis TaxID=542762 RepID=A0A4S4EL78_CAMSN|nr:hypothetical protein TEA_024149 [Camellia sinensis var. sinensis]
MLGKPIANLRLLHYEGRVSDPMKGIYGAGAHSDFGLITLLATWDCDLFNLLQICKDKDAKPQKWEFVAPLKGSTLHRVLGNGQERYSIAYFVEPNHDCLVECLPTCQSQENPPKYQEGIKYKFRQYYRVQHAKWSNPCFSTWAARAAVSPACVAVSPACAAKRPACAAVMPRTCLFDSSQPSKFFISRMCGCDSRTCGWGSRTCGDLPQFPVRNSTFSSLGQLNLKHKLRIKFMQYYGLILQ